MSSAEDFTYGGGPSILTSVVQTYDERGRLDVETAPFRSGDLFLSTSYVYDNLNRLINAVSPTGTSTYSYPILPASNGEYEVSFTSEDNRVQSSTTDAAGKLIRAVDSGNGLTAYTYYSNGNPATTSVNGVQVSTMDYDEHARQISLTEVNSGTTTYDYNSFGEITYQKDSRPTIGATTVAYDLLGRVDFIDQHEGHIEYTYVVSGDGLNQIDNIVNYNGLTESYTYDVLDRISSHAEVINGETFTHSYDYTALDQLNSITYPSGLQVSYEYYAGTGYLRGLLDDQGIRIYEPLQSNRYGQMTQYELGNGLTTQVDYDDFGVLDQMQTQGSNVFNMSYDFNIQNGLLNSRSDHTQQVDGLDLEETFMYDDHYRLLTATVNNGAPALSMSYDAKGNILTKSDVSDQSYLYDVDKIHAVTGINAPGPIGIHNQMVTYNSAHQPLNISEGDHVLNYTYGSDEQRRYAHQQENGSDVYERYYCGDYEEQIINGVIQKIHYLDVGIIAVQEDNNPVEYFFTYGDYLGSVLAVTDRAGNVIERQSFDSWRQRRNAADWTDQSVAQGSLSWLYRGYTGHEMLPRLDIINMNGRLYDPVIGRMFSVDNYAGLDGTSQSYNRYSYVYNNPLMYTDPNGEYPFCPFSPTQFHDVIGAVASGGLLDVTITSGISGLVNTALDGAVAGVSNNQTFVNGELFMDGNGNLTSRPPDNSTVLSNELSQGAILNHSTVSQDLRHDEGARAAELTQVLVNEGELIVHTLQTFELAEGGSVRTPKTKNGFFPIVARPKRGKITSSGRQHGTAEHYKKMNELAEEYADNGYDVYLNKSLNKSLGKKIKDIGGKRPDVTIIDGDHVTLIEVVSPSQTIRQMRDKLAIIRRGLQDQGYSVTTIVKTP